MVRYQSISNSPLISVIIPAYNAERFIGQTLNSVLAQTYQNLEVIVVNDGSIDHTAEIVKEFIEKDSRVTLLQQPNSGVAAARNLGIRYSTGEFIAPIDSDDIWYPQNIEKQVQCMLQSGPEVGLVYSWSIDVDQHSQPTGNMRSSRIEGRVYTTLLIHDFIANASCVLIRRTCLDKAGGYDSSLKQRKGQGGEDWDIYLRIAEHYKFCVVPECLVGYRKLPNSMSTDSSQMAQSRQLIWQKIRQRYPRIPHSIERLSNSSFYIHLALQNHYYANYQTAWEWILQAIKADPITPFLRLGLYKAVAQIALYLLMQKLPLPRQSIATNHSIAKPTASYSKSMKHTLPPASKEVTVQPKALGELLIHWLAPPLFGTSENWL
jgi:glycosyltransferase involved in cell wall biosynthesis